MKYYFHRLITIYLTLTSCLNCDAIRNNDFEYDKRLMNDITFRVSAFEVIQFDCLNQFCFQMDF